MDTIALNCLFLRKSHFFAFWRQTDRHTNGQLLLQFNNETGSIRSFWRSLFRRSLGGATILSLCVAQFKLCLLVHQALNSLAVSHHWRYNLSQLSTASHLALRSTENHAVVSVSVNMHCSSSSLEQLRDVSTYHATVRRSTSLMWIQ